MFDFISVSETVFLPRILFSENLCEMCCRIAIQSNVEGDILQYSKDLVGGFLSSHYRGDEIPLIDTGF